MPQPLERDLEETRDRLTAWFRAQLPEASAIGIDELRGPGTTGFSSDTLIFTLSRRERGETLLEDLVARLEPGGDFRVFPTYDVALQFKMMKAMHERDVPVPRMRWLEEDPAPMGVPFYIMERLDGQVPTDSPPYHTGGWVSELPPDDRAELWWNGFEAMCKVHKVDWRHPDFDVLERPGEGVTNIERGLDYWDRYLSWGMQRQRYPLLERVLGWLRENRPEEEIAGICWGDARLANQIFDSLRCVAVIDWEMVFLGNPEADLAWWVTLDRCFSEGLGVERLENMPDRDATVARWESLVGRKASHLPYYEIYAAFRFSAIMARVGLQMKHYGVLPEDHDWDVTNLGSLTLARMFEEIAGSDS